jgi:hypothetical protein
MMWDAQSAAKDHSKGSASGERLVKGRDQNRDQTTWAMVSDVPERQAVTGHFVRYVLIGGLAGAVIGMSAVFLTYFH